MLFTFVSVPPCCSLVPVVWEVKLQVLAGDPYKHYQWGNQWARDHPSCGLFYENVKYGKSHICAKQENWGYKIAVVIIIVFCLVKVYWATWRTRIQICYLNNIMGFILGLLLLSDSLTNVWTLHMTHIIGALGRGKSSFYFIFFKRNFHEKLKKAYLKNYI